MLDLHSRPAVRLSAISSAEEIVGIQKMLDSVFCSAELKGYIIDLVRKSREHSALVLGASPRAAITLMKAARGHALIHGREFVTHEDIRRFVYQSWGID